MPLQHPSGRKFSKEAIENALSANIKELIGSGREQDQAAAIAYSDMRRWLQKKAGRVPAWLQNRRGSK